MTEKKKEEIKTPKIGERPSCPLQSGVKCLATGLQMHPDWNAAMMQVLIDVAGAETDGEMEILKCDFCPGWHVLEKGI